jgi:hypothetical protein
MSLRIRGEKYRATGTANMKRVKEAENRRGVRSTSANRSKLHRSTNKRARYVGTPVYNVTYGATRDVGWIYEK